MRAVQEEPIYLLFFSVAPYYHALNSCFLAQIWVTGRMPATSELSCPRISAGERNPKYPGSGFGRNQESAVRIEPIYFRFLRASVTPWCKGFVFGCGYVAPCLHGAKVLLPINPIQHSHHFLAPPSTDAPSADTAP